MTLAMLPVALLLTAGTPEDGSVALLPLVASGLAADEIDHVADTVQRAVDAEFGPRSISAPVVRARLEKGGAIGLRCDRTDPSCSAQLGAVCEANIVLVATFANAKGKASLAVRMVDVGEAAQIAHARSELPTDPGVDDVRRVLARLAAPAARMARVTVSGDDGAEVVVDGVARGALPLPAIDDLAPGPHEIVVGDFHAKVDVRRGEPVTVDAPRTPKQAVTRTPPPAPAPSSAPLYVAAAGASAILVGGVAAAIGLAPLLSRNDSVARLEAQRAAAAQDPALLDDDAVRADYASAEASTEAWNTWGVTSVVAGGALAGAGVITSAVAAALYIGE